MFERQLVVVDVGVPFIPHVVRYATGMHQATGEPVRVVFPNRRSGRFFLHELTPEMALHITPMSMDELVEDLIYSGLGDQPALVGDMDRYFLLLKLIRQQFPALYRKLGDQPDRVFPWCIQLARLMDELDMHLVQEVQPVAFADEVVPAARDILAELDQLVAAYRQELDRLNWTGGGNRYARASEMCEQLNGPLLVAGFAGLSIAERTIFRSAWDRDQATIIFQTDLHGRHAPFSPYRVHDDWLNGTMWGRRPDRKILNKSASSPAVVPVETYDIHSQVATLSGVLMDGGSRLEQTPTTAAVVVPDSSILVPVVQSIPQQKLNVTAGYPFCQTNFYRLLIQIIQLIENEIEKSGIHLDHVLHILANPLVRPVICSHQPLTENPVDPVNEIIGWGQAFMDPDALCQRLRAAGHVDAGAFLDTLIFPCRTVRSLDELAEQVDRLARFVLDRFSGAAGLETEQELIAHFLETLHMGFSISHFREEKFPSSGVLFGLLRHLMDTVQIQFEGNPLEGLQVMGFLETRLLTFDHLFILDLNEGTIPGDHTIDPLLPVNLREPIGLPSVEQREAVEAYHLFRLLDGSRYAHLFYRKGETTENRSVRSRYLEQLLVEWETRACGDNGSLDPVWFEQKHVQVTEMHLSGEGDHRREPPVLGEAEMILLDEKKKSGLSPSYLDEVLKCPYRFYLRRFRRVPESARLQEGQDPRQVGDWVHHALEHAFGPIVGKSLNFKILKTLETDTSERLNNSLDQVLPGLSPVRRQLLKTVAGYRIAQFFRALREELADVDIRILAVEEKYATIVKGVKWVGRCDRLDLRTNKTTGEERLVVCDYKTGSSAKVPKKSRKPGAAWVSLAGEIATLSQTEAISLLQKELGSFQLPMYGYLVSVSRDVEMEQVGSELVLLGAGETKSYDCGNMGSKGFEAIAESVINLLKPGFVFEPMDTEECEYCPYFRICRFTTHQQASFRR